MPRRLPSGWSYSVSAGQDRSPSGPQVHCRIHVPVVDDTTVGDLMRADYFTYDPAKPLSEGIIHLLGTYDEPARVTCSTVGVRRYFTVAD